MDEYPRQFNAFGALIMHRIGKGKAGRMLDGKAWTQFPEVRG